MLLATALLLPFFTVPFTQSGPPSDGPELLRDRRLVSTELWLVDRRPDGTERSEQFVLRGRFDERQRFYFDDILETGMSLDIFGDLVARPRDGQIELEISTQRRLSRNDGSKEPQGAFRFGFVRSRVQLKSEDVVSVELPPVTDIDPTPLKGHTLSLRVRSRQIRAADGAATTQSVEVARNRLADVQRRHEIGFVPAAAVAEAQRDYAAAQRVAARGTQSSAKDVPRFTITGFVRSPGVYEWQRPRGGKSWPDDKGD